MAKRTSVFDDPTMEIQELTALIKQDITALNSAVVELQLLSNSRNENGNISSDTTSHSTTVVDDLKNRLMSTTKEFKEVLTMRTEVSLNVSLFMVIQLGWWAELENVSVYCFIFRFILYPRLMVLFLCSWRIWRFMRIEDNCFRLARPKILQILLFVSVH